LIALFFQPDAQQVFVLFQLYASFDVSVMRSRTTTSKRRGGLFPGAVLSPCMKSLSQSGHACKGQKTKQVWGERVNRQGAGTQTGQGSFSATKRLR
jgi:hypothetical protein